MRDPLDLSAGLANELKPIQQRLSLRVWPGIVVSMGPPPLSGHDVFQSVAVHVGKRQSMKFAKSHRLVGLFPLATIRRGGVSHDGVGFPGDVALRIPDLFEPREAPTVRCETGDHIGQAVTVDVIDKHVRPPRPRSLHFGPTFPAEWRGVEFPETVVARRWLLPPAARLHDIQPSIAINVPDAKTVTSPILCFRNGVKFPGFRRI